MGAGALLGPLCESLPISAGAWWYAAPAEVFGMPAYMILAYAIFGGLLGHASRAAGAMLSGGIAGTEKDDGIVVTRPKLHRSGRCEGPKMARTKKEN